MQFKLIKKKKNDKKYFKDEPEKYVLVFSYRFKEVVSWSLEEEMNFEKLTINFNIDCPIDEIGLYDIDNFCWLFRNKITEIEINDGDKIEITKEEIDKMIEGKLTEDEEPNPWEEKLKWKEGKR